MLLPLLVAAAIAAPDSWREERFTFPLVFAPSIPYEGEEVVRFSPDFTKFSGNRGFTYVILWDIKRRTLEPSEIERGLAVYFDGLMENVTRARKIEDPGTVTSTSLHPMSAPKGWDRGLGGQLWTWNAFSKGEPLVLNLEITHRACGTDRTQIFYAFSMAARGEPAWDELRKVRSDTQCAKAP
jgi:hypothetical protein